MVDHALSILESHPEDWFDTECLEWLAASGSAPS
jgi:hypothetical protein